MKRVKFASLLCVILAVGMLLPLAACGSGGAKDAKPVETVADLRGLNLRCPTGGVSEVLRAWGANPILMNSNCRLISWSETIPVFLFPDKLEFICPSFSFYHRL